MTADLVRYIHSFPRRRVVVVGEAMLDSYLHGASDRLCREAPVPIVAVSRRDDAPGGAANTAANLRALGGDVAFLSAVGADPEGALVRGALERAGVSHEHVLTDAWRRTLAKHRVLAGGQLLVRFDQGGAEPLGRDTERRLIRRLESLLPNADAVVVSDYRYGLMTPAVIGALARLQKRAPRLLVVDSRTPAAYRHARVTAIKPNYDEAVRLLGLRRADGLAGRAEQMAAHGPRLLDLAAASIAAVTLDSEGALVFERGSEPYRTYARPNPDSRAAGAGDTFVAALALALASGADTPAAVEIASAAAAVVVERDGTAVCSAHELAGYVASGDKCITDPDELAVRVAAHREQGHRIIFTNGCFDILHRGHVTYLSRAKALGDVLVVGVNSDASVRRLKGEGRPINSLDDRVQVLAALSCVDHIAPFDDETPARLIERVRPDVFVKGGDYTRETLPEAPLVERLGGQVHLLPYLDDRSTTAMIERIRSADAAERQAAGRTHGHASRLGHRA